MRNLLVFHLEVDFGEDISLIANNQRDLEEYLRENHNFEDIKFSDLDVSYGTCSFRNTFDESREVAKCFYAKHI